MGCLLDLIKNFIEYCVYSFCTMVDFLLLSRCYKASCHCCFDCYCGCGIEENILGVTYVASFLYVYKI